VSDLFPDTSEIVRAVFAHAAELMKAGSSPEDIRRNLVENGLDEKSAATCVRKLFELRARVQRKLARRQIFLGSCCAVAGALLWAGSLYAGLRGEYHLIGVAGLCFGGYGLYRGIRLSRNT
jgi:hypothetical protein